MQKLRKRRIADVQTQVLRAGSRIASVLLLLLVVALVSYYLFGAANLYINSDTADSLLWAQASYEAQSLVNPDFFYATILPFGAHLLMVPFVAAFGLSVTAQSFGMLLFFLLLTAAMLFFFRSLGWGWNAVCIGTSFLILLTLAAPWTRSLYYHHILYYSQGFLFALVGIGLLLRLMKAELEQERKRTIRLSVLLALLVAATSVNGEMTLAIFSIPLIGTFALNRLLLETSKGMLTKDKRHAYQTFFILAGSTVAGLVVRLILCRGMQAAYADSMTFLISPQEWKEHAGNLLKFLMELTVGDTIEYSVMSRAGMAAVVQLLSGITILVVPVIALVRLKTLQDRWERIVVLFHWVTTALFLFLFTFFFYGTAPWRLLPVLMTGAVATVVYLRHLLGGAFLPAQRTAKVLVALLAAYALFNGYYIAKLPSDYQTADSYRLIAFLEEHGLSDGYATYWNASGPTVYADEEIRIRPIRLTGNAVQLSPYQSNRNWYTGALDTCFLYLTHEEAEEYAGAIPGDYTQRLAYGDALVYVYDYNIVRPR